MSIALDQGKKSLQDPQSLQPTDFVTWQKAVSSNASSNSMVDRDCVDALHLEAVTLFQKCLIQTLPQSIAAIGQNIAIANSAKAQILDEIKKVNVERHPPLYQQFEVHSKRIAELTKSLNDAVALSTPDALNGTVIRRDLKENHHAIKLERNGYSFATIVLEKDKNGWKVADMFLFVPPIEVSQQLIALSLHSNTPGIDNRIGVNQP
jgi:hypothetical protein